MGARWAQAGLQDEAGWQQQEDPQTGQRLAQTLVSSRPKDVS